MSPEWVSWCERHATIFALSTDADARMLQEWCSLFGAAGWTPSELREATDWIALNSHPRFRSDHLAALQGHVRQGRQRHGPPDEAPDDMGQCVECRGAGLVPVPNPRALALGRWGQMAVACRCALGRWFGDHGNHLRLEVYQANHPDWRRMMQEHDELLSRGVRAREFTRAVDDALGAIHRRLRARFSDNEEEKT